VGQLTIVDFAFEPSAVQAGPEGALTVTNTGDVTHTFTMDDGSIDQELEPGQSVDVIIGTAGAFHCEIHPQMTGTIETD
jgi:plastocyanin